MNIAADTLKRWADMIQVELDELVLVQGHISSDRDKLEEVKRAMSLTESAIRECYFDAVNDEAKPGVLPFQVISAPPGSQVKCPTKVMPAFVPDVPGAYILRAVASR